MYGSSGFENEQQRALQRDLVFAGDDTLSVRGASQVPAESCRRLEQLGPVVVGSVLTDLNPDLSTVEDL